VTGSGERAGGTRLVRDGDRPTGWTLFIDGVPHSHVDLDDPRYLEFEYVRRLGHIIDAAAPEGAAIRVLHLGAGALTLARYVAVTRAGSSQLAVDNDAALVELVRSELPLPRWHRIRVRIGDARAELDGMQPGSFDLVISDVFAAGHTPARLTSAEFMRAGRRALADGGIFAMNVADGPPLAHTRRQAATAISVFAHTCLIADAAVLRGRRYGNLVLAGSEREFPAGRLTRLAAGDPMPGRVLDDHDLTRFAAGARPVTDETAQPSPAAPRNLFT
jgi:spermidine synthase